MNIKDYDLYVFDVDGTLYYQNELRLIMAKRLIGYYLLHPLMIKDLLIIKSFRELREKAESVDNLYALTAKKCKVKEERVKKVIKKWIYENPIDALVMSKDEKLLELINELKDMGKLVAIWSDYAADDKLSALNIECEHVYTAEDDRVKELKPSPKGLNLIIKDLEVNKERVIMIGDRMVKDGEAAKAAGVDYLILDKSRKKRHLNLK